MEPPADEAQTDDQTDDLPIERWEIVFEHGVKIRREDSKDSAAIGLKRVGHVVAGKLRGEWIELMGEPGYMLLETETETLLSKLEDAQDCDLWTQELKVSVVGAFGDTVAEFNLPAAASVKLLRQSISDLKKTPIYTQCLLCGTRVLEDDDRLSTLGPTPLVQMVCLPFDDGRGQDLLVSCREDEPLLDLTKALVARADPNFSLPHDGITALHMMALKGLLCEVWALCEAGADKDKEANNGEFALMLAASLGHLLVVQYLVETGADINKVSCSQTPMVQAASRGHANVVEYLWKAGAKRLAFTGAMTPLILACDKGHDHVVDCLGGLQADVNETMVQGITPLVAAAEKGHAKVIQRLLEFRAAHDAVTVDACSALMIAAQNGHSGAVACLIEYGASTHCLMPDGSTPLIRAAANGHAAAIRVLCEARADINYTMVSNSSIALHAAVCNQHLESTQVLCEFGADREQECSFSGKGGFTPLIIARQKGFKELEDYLQSLDSCLPPEP